MNTATTSTKGFAFLSRPWLLLLLAVLAFAVAVQLSEMGVVRTIVGPTIGVGALLGFAGARAAWQGLWRSPRTVVGVLSDIVSLLINGLFGLVGTLVALVVTTDFHRGRQVRRRGRVQLPNTVSGEWTACSIAPLVGAPTGVAEQWVDNARTEHASVAAFARLSLDLMALAAPPALLVGAQQDALDEIRHTELCFALARACGAQHTGPDRFDAADPVVRLPLPRTLKLATLAVDSLIDGALHEGVSARVVARLARRTSHPEIEAVLREIARDEGRHAAHGWDVVQFCLDVGGAPVAHALAGAVRGLADTHPGSTAGRGVDGSLEDWGIPGHLLEAEEFALAVVDLKARVATLTAPLLAKRAA